ncbi:MAG: Protein TolB [Anaerolineales bacterium]|nr:Protein TolB [Anaerolineales bacterium]
MNKNIIDQLPADEQPIALKLQDAAKKMNIPAAFELELENQLMEKYKTKHQPTGWATFAGSFGWAFAAVCTLFLLNWAIRTLVPNIQPASGETPASEIPFGENVRAGNICKDSLTLTHGFSVFVTNEDKTGFIELDEQRAIGELRSIAWSADGQLAIVGNTTGNGNIYLVDLADNSLRPLVPNSELGYLMDVAWSQDGRQLATWSSQNNKMLYLLNSDGSNLLKKHLNVQILGKPLFWPDGSSVLFYGARSNNAGLFETFLVASDTALINSAVEDPSSYIFSPNGSYLATMEYDRENGQAELISRNLRTYELAVLGILPIPKGSGSSLPETANLSWSAEGTFLTFEFGRSASDRAIYLAHADGSGLIRLVDAAHAPAISSDGNCLAYISNGQVFLLDLNNMDSAPVLLADLPDGRSIADFRLDQLQWQP